MSDVPSSDAPAWPGYPDAPRPSFAAPFVPLEQRSLPVASMAEHPHDAASAAPSLSRPPGCSFKLWRPVFPPLERWSSERYTAEGQAAIAVSIVPDVQSFLTRSRGLTPTLRAEVRRREAEGVVPATHAEVVGADLELALATPEEQADASVRLAEERERRRLSADELRARFAPTYQWLKALAALVAARAEAERREAAEATARGGRSLLDEILEGEAAIPTVSRGDPLADAAAASPRVGDIWRCPDGDRRTLKNPAPSYGSDAWETEEGKVVSLSGMVRIGAQIRVRGWFFADATKETP